MSQEDLADRAGCTGATSAGPNVVIAIRPSLFCAVCFRLWVNLDGLRQGARSTTELSGNRSRSPASEGVGFSSRRGTSMLLEWHPSPLDTGVFDVSLPTTPPRPDRKRDEGGLLLWMLRHRFVTLFAAFVVLAVGGAALSDEQASPPKASGEATPTVSPTIATSSPPAPTSVGVPPLEGASLKEAVSALEGLGFEVQVVEKYSRTDANSVLRLSEDPGTTLEEGTTITLVVAEPIPRLPNIVGKSSSGAISQLKDAGYEVRVVRQESSQRVGSVIGLRPSAGSPLIPGKPVTVVVAKDKPEPAPSCDSNYSGYCVPVVSYDLDCANVGSFFQVVGSDKHGFDGDSDGIACES